MTDVDTLSSPNWPSILEALQLTKRISEIETIDIIGKEMSSLEKWEAFYITYAKWKGISIRIDDVKRKGDKIIMRRWVCSKEGLRRDQFINMTNRKKRPKPITRTGCQAALRVVRIRDSDTWIAKEFVPSHNHEIASVLEMQFLRSNRKVPDDVATQIMSMNKVGIKMSNIVSHVALQYGGYDKLPFQLRDVYNKVAALRKLGNLETDSEGALGYLDCLSRKDTDLYIEYQVDEEDRLSNLFWSDGISRRDFAAFGEVLAFDTTYKTNKYHKPLCILVGVNHHFESCVFGLALLLDETIDTFCWLLRVFMDCMQNKKPSVVLTDGDPAMRYAISEFMPDTTHRLYGWHLGNNATRNVKNPLFKRGFVDLMYNYYTKEEFDRKWSALLDSFDLVDNEWCRQLYEKRENWAEAYLRGHFFGGMRTTQRYESMNFAIKKDLQHVEKYTLRDFVSQLDFALSKMRHTELHSDYISKHTMPELLPPTNVLRTYYQQANDIFTRTLYYKIIEQISKEHAYTITTHEDQVGVLHFPFVKVWSW